MNLQTEHLSAFCPLYLSYRMKQDLLPYYQDEEYGLCRRLMQLKNTFCLLQGVLSCMCLQQGAGNGLG